MPKVYLRKRGETYVEVDPQIMRWRKAKPTITFEHRPTLGRPKGKKKPIQFKKFF